MRDQSISRQISKLLDALYQDIDTLKESNQFLRERCGRLERALRNYVTVVESMPDFATAQDYARLLAPVQQSAQELLAK